MGAKNPKLEIYRNLHQDCWSVRDRGLVAFHSLDLIAENVQLVVQPAGREKVIQTGRKNVHAFVRASSVIINDSLSIPRPSSFTRIRYNPHCYDSFVDDKENPIHFADYVFMQRDGRCYAKI